MGSFNQIVCAKVIMQLCNNQICLSGKGLGNWFHIHIVLHPKEAIHEKEHIETGIGQWSLPKKGNQHFLFMHIFANTCKYLFPTIGQIM